MKLLCEYCGKEATKECSICKINYCSDICQQKDWKFHKEKCKKPTLEIYAISNNFLRFRPYELFP